MSAHHATAPPRDEKPDTLTLADFVAAKARGREIQFRYPRGWRRTGALPEETDDLTRWRIPLGPPHAEAQQEAASRAAFESAIGGHPYHHCPSRYPSEPPTAVWPGQYTDYDTQLAWEMWERSRKRILQLCEIPNEN